MSENDALKRNAATLSYSMLLASGQLFGFGTQNGTGLLSKIENDFTQNTDPITKRYTIVLNKQTATDYLTNVKTEKLFSDYSPDFFLPQTVVSKNYLNTSLQGTTTVVTNFDNNTSGVGANYYIGRTNQVETTIAAYGDTKSNKIKYGYNGPNITKIEKTANNSGEVHIEEMDYFANGLLKKKTISAVVINPTMAVTPRTVSFTYDISNRFVKTTTDAEGLTTTNNLYHPLYGLVLNQTNPYGLSTTTVYDNWGKQTKVTDFLGKSANFAYVFSSGIYTTTQTSDDGSSSVIENDALGRSIRKGAKDINGFWNFANTEYDYAGRKFRESEPYAQNGSPSQWTTTYYDDYNRPVRVEAFTGKNVYNVYDGLSGTTYQPGLTKSTTKDANGNVISATDLPGGTITFQYLANGLQIVSNYDGIKIASEYDDWGRKVALHDPSAGDYSYSYNAFGETKTEVAPKGVSTYYYDNFGKLIRKNCTGNTPDEKTDIRTEFNYSSESKLLISNKVMNLYDGNSEYLYTYDQQRKRVHLKNCLMLSL